MIKLTTPVDVRNSIICSRFSLKQVINEAGFDNIRMLDPNKCNNIDFWKLQKIVNAYNKLLKELDDKQ